MIRFKAKYQEFRNINIQVELVELGGKLMARLHAAADAPIPSGMKRFSSEQHVSLENFLDGLRSRAGAASVVETKETPEEELARLCPGLTEMAEMEALLKDKTPQAAPPAPNDYEPGPSIIRGGSEA